MIRIFETYNYVLKLGSFDCCLSDSDTQGLEAWQHRSVVRPSQDHRQSSLPHSGAVRLWKPASLVDQDAWAHAQRVDLSPVTIAPVLYILGYAFTKWYHPTWDNDCTKDIRARIAKAKGVMTVFSNVWKSRQISYKIKVNILESCVFSVALFACETWTLKKTDKDLLLAFQMHCYRSILQVRWTQKVKKKLRLGNVRMQKMTYYRY